MYRVRSTRREWLVDTRSAPIRSLASSRGETCDLQVKLIIALADDRCEWNGRRDELLRAASKRRPYQFSPITRTCEAWLAQGRISREIQEVITKTSQTYRTLNRLTTLSDMSYQYSIFLKTYHSYKAAF